MIASCQAARFALLLAAWAAPGSGQEPAPPGPVTERSAQQPLVFLSAERARDMTGADLAFLELTTPRSAYYVHEPIRLRLRFGIEDEFLHGALVQPFRQQLDVPVQLAAPWLRDLPGAIPLADEPDEPPGAGGEPRLSFALNEGLARARTVEYRRLDGRHFSVLELEASYLASAAGELMIPAPLLRFAYATRFEEDLINGRMAADRIDAFVTGRGLTLEIRPLPEEGRPREFSGAVGSFTLSAEARPRRLAPGESLALVLSIAGQGDLEHFDAPRLDGLAGFHVNGAVEDRHGGRRTITYDLAPLGADVHEVPPLPFVFFDPGPPAEYRTLWTLPIALEVRPRSVDADTDSGTGGRALEPSPGGDPGLTRTARVGALFLLAFLGLALAAHLRRRASASR